LQLFLNQRALFDLFRETALLLEKRNDLPRVCLHIVLKQTQIEPDLGELCFGKLIDKVELVVRRFRDVLNLVLAVNVRRDQARSFQRNWPSAAIQNDRLAIERSRDRIGHPVLRLDLHFHPSALKVCPDDAIEAPAKWIAIAPWHDVQGEPNQFED